MLDVETTRAEVMEAHATDAWTHPDFIFPEAQRRFDKALEEFEKAIRAEYYDA